MGKRRKPGNRAVATENSADVEEPLIFSGGEDSDTFEAYEKMGLVYFEEITGEEAAKMLKNLSSRKETEPKPKKAMKAKKTKDTSKPAESEEAVIVEELKPGDLKAWRKYPLSDSVLRGLKKLGFAKPTPIQEQTLDAFYCSGEPRDVLGSAPTGSGKTLAFGLPILNYISHLKPEEEKASCLAALIISPTRELALQIKQHLSAVSPEARIAILIGGMSSEKQERLLSKNPNIIIGTPGRLDECLKGDEGLAERVGRVPFLVIDEADRLVESGHFKELDSILATVYRDAGFKERRTFLFSATLDFEPSADSSKNKKNKQGKSLSRLEQLRAKIRFCSSSPTVITLTAKHKVAEKISISKIYCLPEEKDLFLVYSLLKAPFSKVIVFVNAIDILKRVSPVLEVFGLPVTTLHAQMQQRQRLQHLDKFRAADRMILVTSDVSARGLDIPAVERVIHYHLPSAADTFVHRCGRTGRAQESGTSLALIAPQELQLEQKISAHLKLGKELAEEPAVDLVRVESLKGLVDLARKIETLLGKMIKQSKEQSWEAKAAEDLGFDLPNSKKAKKGDDEGDDRTLRKAKSELAALKAQFASLRKSLRL